MIQTIKTITIEMIKNKVVFLFLFCNKKIQE